MQPKMKSYVVIGIMALALALTTSACGTGEPAAEPSAPSSSTADNNALGAPSTSPDTTQPQTPTAAFPTQAPSPSAVAGGHNGA